MKTKTALVFAWSAFTVAATVSTCVAQSNQFRYEVVDLGAPQREDIPGKETATTGPFALNNHGEVVGTFNTWRDDKEQFVAPGRGAFIYLPEAKYGLPAGISVLDVDPPGLPAAGQGRGAARDINDGGQIAGEYLNAQLDTHAFLWETGAVTDLGVVGSGTTSSGYALNQNGWVVGSSTRTDDNLTGLFFYNGSMNPLPHDEINGLRTTARLPIDVNNANAIIANSSSRGYLWASGANPMELMPPDPEGSSRAYAINNVGEVAGEVAVNGGTAFAAIWNAAWNELDKTFTLTDGSLAEVTASKALAINNLGACVGTCDFIFGASLRRNQPCAWIGGELIVFSFQNLIDPESGWAIQSVVDINDDGQILAGARLVLPGQPVVDHAVLLVPAAPRGEGFYWSGDAGDNNWHGLNIDKTNWQDNKGNTVNPPGEGGDEMVFIEDADVVLQDEAVMIGMLTATGSLGVSQDMILAGDSTVENLTAGGGAVLMPQGRLRLSGEENRLRVGAVEGGSTGVLEVGPDAVFAFDETSTIDIPILNRGTLRRVGGDQFTALLGEIVNMDGSSVSVEAGGIALQHDVSFNGTSSLELADGTEVRMEGGEFTVSGDWTANGDGGMVILAGQFFVETDSTATFGLSRDGEAGLVIDGITPSVAGSGSILNTGRATLREAALFATDFENAASATFLLSGRESELMNRTFTGMELVNRGLVRQTYSYGFQEATIQNFATYNLVADADIKTDSEMSRFVNEADATLDKDGGGESVVETAFENSGRIAVTEDSILRFSGKTTFREPEGLGSGSEIVIRDASQVILESKSLSEFSPTEFMGTTSAAGEGTLLIDGFLSLSEATLNFGCQMIEWRSGDILAPGSDTASSLNVLQDELFGLTATLNVTGTENRVLAVRLNNHGRFQIGVPVAVFLEEVEQFSTVENSGDLPFVIHPGEIIAVRSGTSVLSGGTWIIANGAALNFTVPPGNRPVFLIEEGPEDNPTEIRLSGSATLGPLPNVDGDLLMDGRLSLSGGAQATVSGSLAIGFGGILQLESGVSMLVGGELVSGGSVEGEGEIIANMRNVGTVKPGSSPGIFKVSGAFAQMDPGSLQIEIGGIEPGTDYDQVLVSGAAELGGALNVTLINDFMPKRGQTFTILEAESVSGVFDSVTLEDLENDMVFALHYADSSVLLGVISSNFADEDVDGMDDGWEFQHFGNQTRDGTEDFDLDGMSDLAEFLAGTLPDDPDSLLRIHSNPDVDGGSVVVSWDAVPGKSYRVEFKDRLTDPEWTPLEGDVTADSAVASKTDNSASGMPHRYYRIVLLP